MSISTKRSSILFLFLFCYCQSTVEFNPNKAHHGTCSFNSTGISSTRQWIKMMRKEGPYPQVTKKEIDSAITTVNKHIIHNPTDHPQITWIGHATALVQYRGINYLTDPHLTKRASPLKRIGNKRLTKPALTFKEIPPINFIVISHNHYDHLDRRTVEMFKNRVTWFVPLGLKCWFMERGIIENKIIELDWWDTYQYEDSISITFTPTNHWSKRKLTDANKSLWGSWFVKIDNFSSWFAGDTGYDKKMFTEIGNKLGPIDLSIIPIGAYAPRYYMAPQHVDPVHAIEIHKDVRSKLSVPIHWGTFQLTHEPFLEPPALLKGELKYQGIPFETFPVMKIGETLVIKDYAHE